MTAKMFLQCELVLSLVHNVTLGLALHCVLSHSVVASYCEHADIFRRTATQHSARIDSISLFAYPALRLTNQQCKAQHHNIIVNQA